VFHLKERTSRAEPREARMTGIGPELQSMSLSQGQADLGSRLIPVCFRVGKTFNCVIKLK